MAFAFVRRTAHGMSFHTPDKEHIHHRLLRLGHGPRRSVVILWAWTAIFSGFLLFPLFMHQANAFIPLGAAALGRRPVHPLPSRVAQGNVVERLPRWRGPRNLESGLLRRQRMRSAEVVDSPDLGPGIVWTRSGPECDDGGLCFPSTSPRPTPRFRGLSADGLWLATHRVKERISHAWTSRRRCARPDR